MTVRALANDAGHFLAFIVLAVPASIYRLSRIWKVLIAITNFQVVPMSKLRKLDRWHEDDGPVLWWKLPITEPPYVGTPLDMPDTIYVAVYVGKDNYQYPIQVGGGWPGYHTHWTPYEEPEDS